MRLTCTLAAAAILSAELWTSLAWWSALAGFAGGVLLSWDALWLQRRGARRKGLLAMLGAIKAAEDVKEVLETRKGPLADADAVDKYLETRSQRVARWGFGLVTASFLLQALDLLRRVSSSQ
jgi:hypothetical protein